MNNDLNTKKIVVVGGSSGIGFAVTQQLLAKGASVIIASRSEHKLLLAKQSLSSPLLQTMQLDASNMESVKAFFIAVGAIDHLIMTIKPTLPAGRFLDNDIMLAKQAFDAKFWGQYQLAKVGAAYIQEHGSIIFTSGIASQRSYVGYSIIAAMNAATEALCRALACELAPIRVNAVCPGFVDTSPASVERAAYVRALAPFLPLARLGQSSEIASAYLYLLTSSYTTGSVFIVDGGASV